MRGGVVHEGTAAGEGGAAEGTAEIIRLCAGASADEVGADTEEEDEG